jgi:hypothetical protein
LAKKIKHELMTVVLADGVKSLAHKFFYLGLYYPLLLLGALAKNKKVEIVEVLAKLEVILATFLRLEFSVQC